MPVEKEKQRKPQTDVQIIIFVIALCLSCGLLLAAVSFGLRSPQKNARDFDQSKQMLVAAKILNHAGYFEIQQEDGKYAIGEFDAATKTLSKAKDQKHAVKASKEAINLLSTTRIRPLMVDKAGQLFTPETARVKLQEYLEQHKKQGYAHLDFKLLYAILPNDLKAQNLEAQDIIQDLTRIDAVVIPVSGYGLWGPIYGYIALKSDGNTVIGTTWYEHGETPGLGANITEAWWQKQFFGKEIFQPIANGKTDFATANIGIVVVKGQVKDIFGNSPKARNAVDGMSGATMTGDGVAKAYHNSLDPYRPFLIRLQKANAHGKSKI